MELQRKLGPGRLTPQAASSGSSCHLHLKGWIRKAAGLSNLYMFRTYKLALDHLSISLALASWANSRCRVNEALEEWREQPAGNRTSAMV